jgi:hypothetical protein
MSEKLGVKETREFLVAVNEITIFLIERFADGVSLEDFAAIYKKITKDESFISKMAAAYDNYVAIPNEMDDLDLYETLDLTKMQLDYIPLIVGAFRVPAPIPVPEPVEEPIEEPVEPVEEPVEPVEEPVEPVEPVEEPIEEPVEDAPIFIDPGKY